MHDKPSLFSSRYLGRNGCQAGYENRKPDKINPNTLFQISRSWDHDNILWTLTLNCGQSSFYNSIASCLPLSSLE